MREEETKGIEKEGKIRRNMRSLFGEITVNSTDKEEDNVKKLLAL